MEDREVNYLGFIAMPGVKSMISGGLLGRIPDVMIPTTLLLLIGGRGQIFVSGAVVAAFSLVAATMAPLAAYFLRQFNRPSNGLLLLVLGQTACAMVLWLLLVRHLWTTAQFAGVILVAALTPPIAASVRNGLGLKFGADSAARGYAFSIEGAMGELVVVAGTAGAAFLVATIGVGSLLVACFLRVAGSMLLAGSHIFEPVVPAESRSILPHRIRRNKRRLAVPAKLLFMFLGISILLVSISVFELSLVALGRDMGDAWSSWLLSMLTAASVIGALASGAISSRVDTRQLLAGLSGGLSACLAILATWDRGATIIIPLIVVAAGLCVGCVSALQLEVIGRLMTEGSSMQIYSWLSTVSYGSVAAGSVVGGWLSQHSVGVAVLTASLAAIGSGVFSFLAVRKRKLSPGNQSGPLVSCGVLGCVGACLTGLIVFCFGGGRVCATVV